MELVLSEKALPLYSLRLGGQGLLQRNLSTILHKGYLTRESYLGHLKS